MNHLRQLLEQRELLVLPTDDTRAQEISESDPEALFEEVKQKAGQAVCFWMGDLDTISQLVVIPELCRLPYPTCWFEAEMDSTDGHIFTAALVTQDSDGTMHFVSATRIGPAQEWVLDGVAHGSYSNDRMMDMGQVDASGLAQMRHNIYAVGAFLSALHCSNVRREERVPEAKLQKARAKRGKAPLFSYWTLQFDGKSDRGEDQGGTHASPRVHLRRGHPRQYTPGKWTWVQAHAVGNKSLGVVHKDYSGGPALLVPAR